MAGLYLRHPASLAHDTGAHPERADRVRAVEATLAARDWLGWEVRDAPAATDDQLLRVHPPEHLERVAAACAAGRALDLDTPVVPDSWPAALHAAGGACALVDALCSGTADTGFAALRPPGHHCEPDRAMGFCLLSNAAVAARHALAAHGLERIVILDWDVHHGNGTQAAFYDSAEVLFVSLHQWPFYPGSGAAGETGTGAGEGYTLNLPQPAGSGPAEWLAALDGAALPAARHHRPQLILVSAGYDAHRADPLGGCRLETATYRELAERVAALGAELDAPVGAPLEGGYDLAALAGSVAETMVGLTG